LRNFGQIAKGSEVYSKLSYKSSNFRICSTEGNSNLPKIQWI
jgi:hypothetical protein